MDAHKLFIAMDDRFRSETTYRAVWDWAQMNFGAKYVLVYQIEEADIVLCQTNGFGFYMNKWVANCSRWAEEKGIPCYDFQFYRDVTF